MKIAINELIEKIKSIDDWDWYLDPEVRHYDSFLEHFKEKYPNLNIDLKIIKRIGILLVKNEDISENLIADVQGQNVAFKCTWNDKDFAGICSKEVYESNRKAGRIWCKHAENRCQEISEEEFSKGDYPCYESHALIDFSFGSGIHHIGPKKGEAIALRNVDVNKVALLTTREPNMTEKERFIFAILDIEEIKDERVEEKQIEPVEVYGNKKTSIKIDKRVKLSFWEFHKNPGNPESTKWNTGLFRYVQDDEALKILNKLKEEYLKLGDKEEDIKKVENLIKRYKKLV